MVSVGCMITCSMFSFIDNSFSMPCALNDWINIMGIAIICTALPILLLLQALKYIKSEKAAILSVTEPLFVVIFGIILLGERVSATQIMGAMIVLSGALITVFSSKLSKGSVFLRFVNVFNKKVR